MGVVTLSASSTFAIYLVISQMISIALIYAFDPFVKKLVEKKKDSIKIDETKTKKLDYSR
jgi:membrane protein implicated in regulation of membrane protease activity